MSGKELFLPRKPELKEQCKSCPFREGNDFEFAEVLNKLRVQQGMKPLKGWPRVAMAVTAKATIRNEVEENGDFMCHHTVYDSTGKALVNKDQEQHRQCPGATRHHRGS